jgi:transposase
VARSLAVLIFASALTWRFELSYREVSVIAVREVLRAWLAGAGLRTVAARSGMDRKTARRYVEAAQAAGVLRDGGAAQLTDEVVGQVVLAVRPSRPEGHGSAWRLLVEQQVQIAEWVKQGLTAVKIGELLGRRGVVVPHRTLHRFCEQRCGYVGRRAATTVRVADGDPGVECQLDFGDLGLLADPHTERRRKVRALVFTAVYSRHMFVWLSFSQKLDDVIAGCEAAWAFFGGVYHVLVPDNMSPIVDKADAVNPRLSMGWLDYAQHRGFATDTARVRRPQDKPRVERALQYLQGNFWPGESFVDLDDAQIRVQRWCAATAGLRVHGTTQAQPAVVFAEQEAGLLLPVTGPYDVPVFRTNCKVHRDFHIEMCKALYSIPKDYIGQTVTARADSALVKVFHRGQLIKTHPRQPPGGRSTDRDDLPAEKAAYALRDLDRLAAAAHKHGQNVGIYAERLLEGPLPWTKMRAVYRLLGLTRRYGGEPVDTACGKALDLDVVSVTKIASMLEKAVESTPTPTAAAWAAGSGRPRFARDPGEYATGRRSHLRLIRPTSDSADAQAAGDEGVR